MQLKAWAENKRHRVNTRARTRKRAAPTPTSAPPTPKPIQWVSVPTECADVGNDDELVPHHLHKRNKHGADSDNVDDGGAEGGESDNSSRADSGVNESGDT